MKSTAHWLLLTLGVGFLLAGCDTADEGTTTTPTAPPTIVVEETQPVPTDDPPEEEPETEEVAAEVGFTGKGQYESQNYISVSVGTVFSVTERLILLRVTDAMQKYKAQHGDYPKTEEEFFEHIIEANSIALPELPDGQKYGYDPEAAKANNGEEALTILKPK